MAQFGLGVFGSFLRDASKARRKRIDAVCELREGHIVEGTKDGIGRLHVDGGLGRFRQLFPVEERMLFVGGKRFETLVGFKAFQSGAICRLIVGMICVQRFAKALCEPLHKRFDGIGFE